MIAVFHDVLITLGFFSLFHYEISLTVIAALLTLVGYSMNDTIVIFDRVRENLRLMRREPFRGRREQVHQSDSFANDFDERLNFPDRGGSVPHGRGGASCFRFCHGGGSCGRNVLQFRNRSTHRRGLE